METTCEASALKIRASKALAGVGLVASLPDLRDPEVLLRGVSADSSEKDITEAIYSQNSDLFKGFSRAEFEQQFKLRYRAGQKRNELVNWVAAVCPELHERVSKKGHLWVGWRRCVVHSVNWVTRCFRCQCYGHMAKHCRDSQETCGHCASKGHRTGTCPAKAAGVAPVCAACRRTGRRGNHDLSCRQCPSYMAALERQMSRTKSKSKTTTQTTTVGTTNNDNGQTKQT